VTDGCSPTVRLAAGWVGSDQVVEWGFGISEWCRRVDLNHRPRAYESPALPLSYVGVAPKSYRKSMKTSTAGRVWSTSHMRPRLSEPSPAKLVDSGRCPYSSAVADRR
jgi:hypothetical protein